MPGLPDLNKNGSGPKMGLGVGGSGGASHLASLSPTCALVCVPCGVKARERAPELRVSVKNASVDIVMVSSLRP